MRALLIVALVFAAGCASPYKKDGLFGGYDETQLSPDIFKVRFRGNGYTSRTRAENFTLLRAAELTIENGYRYFAILGSNSSTSTSSFTTPRETHTTGQILTSRSNVATYNANTTETGGQTISFNSPSEGMTIQCFMDKPQGPVLDAEFLANQIRTKYKIK